MLKDATKKSLRNAYLKVTICEFFEKPQLSFYLSSKMINDETLEFEKKKKENERKKWVVRTNGFGRTVDWTHKNILEMYCKIIIQFLILDIDVLYLT